MVESVDALMGQLMKQNRVPRMPQSPSFFSSRTAIMLVIANMVGTGVFTSLGFQLLDIQSPFVILVLWSVGALVALCGALCYAELATALPRSGGEYHFLGRIYHPGAGFTSGWISVTVGFSAPTAAAAITGATYIQAVFPDLPATLVGCVVVVLIGGIHLRSRGGSGLFQQIFTSAKIALILCFMALAWGFTDSVQPVTWSPTASDLTLISSTGFAVGLIFVNYAYTGWNAATYLSGELDNPSRSIPRILIVGTGVVALLYLALHVTFLGLAPMEEMAGKIEIGYVVANYAFGPLGAQATSLMLGFLLISTVSAMLLAGPRALQVMGEDFKAFSWLGQTNAHDVPGNAILLQTGLTLVMILTATFESIILFSGAILAFNSLLTVIGLGVLRYREPDLVRPFRLPWYPLPMLVFAGVISWTLFYLVQARPVEGLLALGLVVIGVLCYLLARRAGFEIAPINQNP